MHAGPPTRRSRFRWGVFAVAATVAAVLHFFVILPYLLLPLIERKEAPIEVAYLDDTPPPELPSASEPAPPPKPDEDKPQPKKAEPIKPEPPKKAPPPEIAKVTPPPPEPAKLPPPKPEPKPEEPKPPPPPPPQALPRMKFVDQKNFPDEADNADARYYAQQNHRAAIDTQGVNRNLVRNHEGETGPQPSEPSQNKDPQPGMKKTVVAELQQQKGLPNQLVRSKPLVGQEGTSPKQPKPGKLAMRDLTPKAAEPVPAEKPREGMEIAPDGVGTLPRARVGTDGERAQAPRKGGNPRIKLNLTARDYDQIEGEAIADKQRRDAARSEVSHAGGRWDRVQRKMAMMRSSLENFTPAVRTGNQAELGTRAHPFAAYITEMHRAIHKLWAYGFLADLDGKSPSSPYNDMDLWTQLEIVLRPDGNVDKVTIVRPSGLATFDAAAMDAVMSSSPFPPPPEVIKSVDGKVYLDWRFHRDDRQCATYFADPHILTSVGQQNTHDVRPDVAEPPRIAPPRTLNRPAAAPAPAATAEEAASAPSSPANASSSVPDQAKDAAEGWFAAYVRGDAGWLAGWSAAPLTAGGEVVASDGPAVKKMYAALLKEAPADRRLDGFEVLTAAGIRAKLGGLPPGGEGDGTMVFAVANVGKEHFVLLLKKSDQGWRVCGIDR